MVATLPGTATLSESPMLPHPYRILRTHKETYDTFTMEMEALDGSALRFAPGQFNMLYVLGVGEVPISISGDPAHPETLVHTVRAVGTVTKAMSKMRRGDILGLRGPFGSSWPVDVAEGKDLVIIAGGIGLPPLRGAIYHALRNREKYNRFILLYGARTPQDLLFLPQVAQWRGRLDMEVEVTVDSAQSEWRGNVGLVTKLIPPAQFDPSNAVAMIVGPEVMMRFTILELQKRGMPPESIYISMERNMKCAIGLCGHCQLGPTFICKDGPVYRYDQISELFGKREL